MKHRSVVRTLFLISIAALALGAHAAEKPPTVKQTKPPPKPKQFIDKTFTPGLLKQSLDGPLSEFDEVVIALRTPGKNNHWYANFGYFAPWPEQELYGDQGRLCLLNLRTKRLVTLIDDPTGAVRDPQVHYDGKKILFSYRKGGQPYYNLYEIDASGTNLKQLTSGAFDDFEPTYLPDGDILFISSRCNRWVNCFLTPVATIYGCRADGSNIRMVSSNTEHDNTPWPLPDGRILYTRWEYVDRSQVHYHHLWASNPDGTNQTIYYGNFHPGWVMIDAKPIPGTRKVLSIFSPGHGRLEHMGEIRIVDPAAGPDALEFAPRVSRENLYNYRDPYPLTSDLFLAAQGSRLVLMDSGGRWDSVFDLSAEDKKKKIELHEPRPLVVRPRERQIPSRVDLEKTTGYLILADIRHGRRMEGITSGEIKKLLVLESLPMPVHFQGGMRPISYGGTFTLERILGTVPVEPDGSAYIELPAMRSVFFIALDENDLAVKRMQSFLSVQPGETTSCAGCHESRVGAGAPTNKPTLLATRRAPSPIEPIEGVPAVIDFPRDVQPILTRHCMPCHDDEKRSGGVSLSGDRGPMFSIAYFNLVRRGQIADGRNEPISNRSPRSIGSAASPLMKKILTGHNDVRLSELERRVVRLWIDSGAAYPGTYAALATGSLGDNLWDERQRPDAKFPAVVAGVGVLQRRCGSCHQNENRVPLMASDEGSPRVPSHASYNLTRPEKSLLLLAPLSKEAGGFGMCRPIDEENNKPIGKPGKGVIANTDDPSYKAILASITRSKQLLDEMKRFDMPGFRPREEYVRELKKYGILPKDFGPDDPIDVYAVDEAYWRSFWLDAPGSAGSVASAATTGAP